MVPAIVPAFIHSEEKIPNKFFGIPEDLRYITIEVKSPSLVLLVD